MFLYYVMGALVTATAGPFVPEPIVGKLRPDFLPVPEEVIELIGFGADGGIVELTDGSIMFAQGGSYRLSTDRGRSWGEPQALNCEVGSSGMIRLQSGALALYGGSKGAWRFSKSTDDGQTWTTPKPILTDPNFFSMFHSMTQSASGRILLVGYWEALNPTAPDAHRDAHGGWGLWRGGVIFMEGHRGPEMGICIAYYSDDEGDTWQQAEGGLFGWFDERGIPNGYGGIIGVYEPTAAETKDGRVLMFMRSKTGRLVQSYSLNDGQTWLSVLPTELSSSQSPPILVRLPSTGDLLCVWNQVSAEEIRRGFLRGRLTAAISKDSGLTWEHFKTLELQEGMEDVAHIAPEFPIPRRIVGRPGLGQLPDGFAMFNYPNVDVVGDLVFIRYGRNWPVALENPPQVPPVLGSQPGAGWYGMSAYWPHFPQDQQATMGGEGVMRIYPVEWFYK